MEKAEFRRRIEIYLDVDLPDVTDRDRIAASLSARLFQYVRQPGDRPATSIDTLRALIPADAMLFFSAPWDGTSQQYRPVVEAAAVQTGRRLIELDVDDGLGGAVAFAVGVLNTPAVAVWADSKFEVVVGERDLDTIVAATQTRP